MSEAKEIVRRFNEDVIAGGNRTAYEELIAPNFVNRSAPPGAPAGPESMWNTFQNVLRPALEGLTVTIHDQMEEGDKVTTRKTISGTHVGPLLGVEATGKTVSIDVIDIVRVVGGRYVEHWGITPYQPCWPVCGRIEPANGGCRNGRRRNGAAGA